MVNSEETSPHIMHCLGNMDSHVAVDMQSQHLHWFGKVSYIVLVLLFSSDNNCS